MIPHPPFLSPHVYRIHLFPSIFRLKWYPILVINSSMFTDSAYFLLIFRLFSPSPSAHIQLVLSCRVGKCTLHRFDGQKCYPIHILHYTSCRKLLQYETQKALGLHRKFQSFNQRKFRDTKQIAYNKIWTTSLIRIVPALHIALWSGLLH